MNQRTYFHGVEFLEGDDEDEEDDDEENANPSPHDSGQTLEHKQGVEGVGKGVLVKKEGSDGPLRVGMSTDKF